MSARIDVIADLSDSSVVSASDVLAVKAVSNALDRVRKTCTDVGVATLLAQVRGLPPEVVCSVLDRLAAAGEAAVESLLHD